MKHDNFIIVMRHHSFTLEDYLDDLIPQILFNRRWYKGHDTTLKSCIDDIETAHNARSSMPHPLKHMLVIFSACDVIKGMAAQKKEYTKVKKRSRTKC